MSLLSRVRSFFSSLLGGDDGSASADGETSTGETAASTDSAAETAGEADTEDAAAYRCAVCGTAVEDAVGPCPLCRSSDIVPADEVDESLTDDDGTGLGTGGATVTRTRDDVDPASRLDEVRNRSNDGGDADADDETGTAEE